MVHLIDKDAVLAEIERRLRELSQLEKASYEIGLYDAYKIVLSFLDTLEVKELQKEPVSEELERAAITAADEDMQGRQIMEESNEKRQLYSRIFRRGFKAGSKWHKEQMMLKAIDGRLYSTICGSEQYIAVPAGYGEYGKDGDKVKVIILEDG